jgi:hypothetical protein
VYGSITPSDRFCGATGPAIAAEGRRRSRTIGRRGLASMASSAGSATHSRWAPSRSATITANGLSSRRLRARSAATAGSLAASAARW